MSQNMFNDKASPYDLDKNISIRACAGAGKTYTLTWRYIAILNYFAKKSKGFGQSNWYGPANVLVITFTRKATAELKSRIIVCRFGQILRRLISLPDYHTREYRI